MMTASRPKLVMAPKGTTVDVPSRPPSSTSRATIFSLSLSIRISLTLWMRAPVARLNTSRPVTLLPFCTLFSLCPGVLVQLGDLLSAAQPSADSCRSRGQRQRHECGQSAVANAAQDVLRVHVRLRRARRAVLLEKLARRTKKATKAHSGEEQDEEEPQAPDEEAVEQACATAVDCRCPACYPATDEEAC